MCERESGASRLIGRPPISSPQISAVREAFSLVYPTAALEVEGVDVESGVSCQVRACVRRSVYGQATGVDGYLISASMLITSASVQPPTPVCLHLQPFSDVETYRGALTRARNAAAAWAVKHPGRARPDFTAGLVSELARMTQLDELDKTASDPATCFCFFGGGQEGGVKVEEVLLPPPPAEDGGGGEERSVLTKLM